MASDDVLRWAIGLVGVSLLLGHLGAASVVAALNLLLRRSASSEKWTAGGEPWEHVPRWLSGAATGLVERLFFTIIIAAGLSGTGIAMIAWTALKGAVYWKEFGTEYQANVFVGALGTLISLLFAVFGALVCTGRLWPG